MKISIKNLTSHLVTTDIGQVQPASSIIFDADDSRIDKVISQLESLRTAGWISFNVQSQARKDYTTSGQLQIYVSDTGDDSAPGSVDSPIATIQEAISRVPSHLSHPVIINIGPGTFKGFRIDGLSIAPSPILGQFLIIRGATTELERFTSTGAVYNYFYSYSTITCTGKSWTVDQFKGKLIQNLTTPIATPIVIMGNTSDTISYYNIAGMSTIGHSFTIFEPATTVRGATSTLAALGSHLVDVASYQEGIAVVKLNDSGAWAANQGIALENVVMYAETGQAAIRANSSSFVLRTSILTGDSTSTAVFLTKSDMNARSVYFAGVYTTKINASYVAENRGVNVTYCLSEGGLNAFFGANLTIAATVIRGCTGSAVRPQSGRTSIGGCAIETCLNAVEVDDRANYTSGSVSPCIGMNAGYISNCTNGIVVMSPRGVVTAKAYAITGATNAVVATLGAIIGLRSDMSIATSAVELQLDSASYTLAAMRAASPKLVRDSNFNTVIYESQFT